MCPFCPEKYIDIVRIVRYHFVGQTSGGADMVQKKEERGIPPYIGWATWNRLTRLMKTFVPPRLDRSYFNSLGFSGTQYSQAIRAFLFLGLMDDTKQPTESLRQLVMGTDEVQKATLRGVLEKAYQPFFANPGPHHATLGDLETYLRSQGAKGVVDKCATFFLAAAKEADIELSPQLAGEFGRKTGRRIKIRKKGQARQAEPIVAITQGQASPGAPTGIIDFGVVTYVAELPEAKQDNWIKAYVRITKVMKQEGM